MMGVVRLGGHTRAGGLCETQFSQKIWRKVKGWAKPRHENARQPRGYVNVAQSRLRPRSGPRAETGGAGPWVPQMLAQPQGFKDVTGVEQSVEAERRSSCSLLG